MIETLFKTALDQTTSGQLEAAEATYRKILADHPDHIPSLGNLSHVLIERGKSAEATVILEHIVKIKDDFAPAFIMLGVVYCQCRRLEEAAAAYRRAISLRPDLAEAYNNLGAALYDLGRPAEAIDVYRTGLELQPNYPELQHNMGSALREMGNAAEAINHLHTSLKLRPGQAGVYNDLGAALFDLMRYDESIDALNKVLEQAPTEWRALNNIAASCRALGQIEKSISFYDRALAAHPDRPSVGGGRLFLLNFRPNADRQAVFEEHRAWGVRHAAKTLEIHRPLGKPLRIGYVSPDFRMHSVAFFSLPVLQSHDRSQFYITCYCTSPQRDSVTENFRACCDQWVDLHTYWNDDAAARRIADDKIDILVDLAGHTAGNRLLVFGRKPAPVQVTYLGYPNTTGLATMDWRLTDVTAESGDADRFHTEKLFRLPRCAWCFQPLSGAPAVVKSQRDEVVFGSFNDMSKINDRVLNLWSRLLKEIPNSRVIVKNAATASPVVREQLVSHGIEVLSRLPDPKVHLQCYHRIDIALDTFPYNGTTTTCEALWMGVPVITLAGKAHASRVGASLLHAVGLDDLIAQDEEDYLRVAAQLAADRARRAELRFALRPRMQSSQLMDPAGLARAVEAAYRTMAEQCLSR
ncbi:MAG TPA: tetratricopeptide repeat protein [Tepidisphaeraceae bacterium]|nr:tetratricopeptide repeat protein [Tepidisphaeraceae bacterium]